MPIVVTNRLHFNSVQSEWPDLTNTGVPSGTSLTPFSGNFETTSNGQVVLARDITGALVILHDDVTVQNCRVTAPSSEICALFIGGNASGTLDLLDSEFDSSNTGGSSGIFYDSNASPPTVEVHRCQIRRTENGIGCLSNFGMWDSYVYDLNPGGGDPHTDGLQTSPNVSNVTLVHNTFDMSGPNTGPNNSCIQLDVNAATNFNWLIQNNKLLLDSSTGGACLRLPNVDASGNNIRVIGNRLKQGVFGYTIPGGPGHGTITEWTDNVDDVTSEAVP